MVSSEGCGRLRWKVTSVGPFVVTSFRLKYQIFRGLRLSLDGPSPFSMSQVHLTSALVNGWQSCHFTPSCSLKVRSLPSLLHFHSVARSPTIWSAESCFSL